MRSISFSSLPRISSSVNPVAAMQLAEAFSELFLLHDLHFCDSLLYYTPFAPDAGRGAENQVQQNLKNLQTKI